MESKVLSFTGQFDKEQVPFKDFKTHQTVEGKFTDRYYFECYDITDPNHLEYGSEGLQMQRRSCFGFQNLRTFWKLLGMVNQTTFLRLMILAHQ
jgi:uncharacterized protein YfeS